MIKDLTPEEFDTLLPGDVVIKGKLAYSITSKRFGKRGYNAKRSFVFENEKGVSLDWEHHEELLREKNDRKEEGR